MLREREEAAALAQAAAVSAITARTEQIFSTMRQLTQTTQKYIESVQTGGLQQYAPEPQDHQPSHVPPGKRSRH
jgi:hypothetical protein